MGGAAGLRYIGEWGALGPKVKGIVTVSISGLEQRAFAGLFSKSVLNMYRRVTGELLNVVPGLAFGYGVYYWATEEHARLKRKDPKRYDHEQ